MSSDGEACCVPTFMSARATAGFDGGVPCGAAHAPVTANAPRPALRKNSRRSMAVDGTRDRGRRGPALRLAQRLLESIGEFPEAPSGDPLPDFFDVVGVALLLSGEGFFLQRVEDLPALVVQVARLSPD